MDSNKNTVYALLRERILTCRLRPNEIVNQQEIMEELGVSKTPVREAIAALAQENFVTIFPRRGVVVSGISANEISDISVARVLVEPYLAGAAASQADAGRLREFLDIFSRGADFMTNTKADFRFHMYLAELSRNPFLISLMDMVLSHNMRLVVLAAELPDRLAVSNEEHRRIIEALLERDGKKAEQRMREHLKCAAESSFESVRGIV